MAGTGVPDLVQAPGGSANYRGPIEHLHPASAGVAMPGANLPSLRGIRRSACPRPAAAPVIRPFRPRLGPAPPRWRAPVSLGRSTPAGVSSVDLEAPLLGADHGVTALPVTLLAPPRPRQPP